MTKKATVVEVLPYLFIFFVSLDLIFNLFIKKTPLLRSIFFVFFFSFICFFYSYIKKKDRAGKGIKISEKIIVVLTVFLLGFIFFTPILGIGKFWQAAVPALIFIGIYVLISYVVIPLFDTINTFENFCRKNKLNIIRGPLKADFLPAVFYIGTAVPGQERHIPFDNVSDLVVINQDFQIFTNTYLLDFNSSLLTEKHFCVAFNIIPVRGYHRLMLNLDKSSLLMDYKINPLLLEIAERFVAISNDELEFNELITKISLFLLSLSDVFQGTTVMDGCLKTDLDIQIKERYFFARMGYFYRQKIELIFEEFKKIYTSLSGNNQKII